ncbi:MAG: hypothetical protein RLZZ77_1515 [Bacteroidota bacterium]|jgi:hypothetical protein
MSLSTYSIQKWMLVLISFITGAFVASPLMAQEHSVAMKWNEVQLNCIRKDAARPTIQARNLFHASVIMYDAWAIYDNDADPFFIGKTWAGYTAPFNGITPPTDVKAAQEKTISYAMYRYLRNRYQNAPNNNWNLFMLGYCNDLMAELGYDTEITSTDYSDGDPAKLGNYIAAQMQAFALQDGSNQQNNYANLYYQTVNGNLFPELPGNALQYDGNRWQPLSLTVILDQNNFPIANGAPALSPEWGNVVPFSLTEADKTVYQRDGHSWNVYHDQGAPPMLDTITPTPTQWDEDFFKWGNVVVALWHSFHDVSDGVMKDISPNSIGNVDITNLPSTFEEFKEFYNEFEGGDPSVGYDINPVTGLPYEEQWVPRGDYSRVLSEYWADGPSSETPPGHWFTLTNYVSSHPMLEKRWGGQGPILDDLEWDVRSYFAMGGAIHDAAIACWGTKGYWDYTRPIMAIRYMIDHGQSSNPELPSFHPAGIPLIPGFIELVQEGDPLAGENNENVNKIKLYTFRGPVAATGQDGVGWILGENWWTFQRRTFVTPPFPGYYSGHSTYSRTGAEVLTRITGTEYFPGGVGEFFAPQNQYLAASTGPSVDVHLQWATYGDASDQCSLSRIYGGLHPPCDDIPGRRVGLLVAPEAFDKAQSYMLADAPHITAVTPEAAFINESFDGQNFHMMAEFSEPMNMSVAPTIAFINDDPTGSTMVPNGGTWLDNRHYEFEFSVTDADLSFDNIVIKIEGATDFDSNVTIPALSPVLVIDMNQPSVTALDANEQLVSDAVVSENTMNLTIHFNEPMSSVAPSIAFGGADGSNTMTYNPASSTWTDNQTFNAVFDLVDSNEEVLGVGFTVSGAIDAAGNSQDIFQIGEVVNIDTQNPTVIEGTMATAVLNESNVGQSVGVSVTFSEPMDPASTPTILFDGLSAESVGLIANGGGWDSSTAYSFVYTLTDADATVLNSTSIVASAQDLAGNIQTTAALMDVVLIDTQKPNGLLSYSNEVITDADVSTPFEVTIHFDEAMNTTSTPDLNLLSGADQTLQFNSASSSWIDPQTYLASYDIIDTNVENASATLNTAGAEDINGNADELDSGIAPLINIDTKNPAVALTLANTYNVISANIGTDGFNVVIIYDEPMNTGVAPTLTFPAENSAALTFNAAGSGWISNTAYNASFNVAGPLTTVLDIDVAINGAEDALGNLQLTETIANFFDVNDVVSVEENNFSATSVMMYPNPAIVGQPITIAFKNLPSDLQVIVLSADGKQVDTNRNVNTTSNTITVDTNGFASGIYFVQLMSENGKLNLRFTLN